MPHTERAGWCTVTVCGRPRGPTGGAPASCSPLPRRARHADSLASLAHAASCATPATLRRVARATVSPSAAPRRRYSATAETSSSAYPPDIAAVQDTDVGGGLRHRRLQVFTQLEDEIEVLLRQRQPECDRRLTGTLELLSPIVDERRGDGARCEDLVGGRALDTCPLGEHEPFRERLAQAVDDGVDGELDRRPGANRPDVEHARPDCLEHGTNSLDVLGRPACHHRQLPVPREGDASRHRRVDQVGAGLFQRCCQSADRQPGRWCSSRPRCAPGRTPSTMPSLPQ